MPGSDRNDRPTEHTGQPGCRERQDGPISTVGGTPSGPAPRATATWARLLAGIFREPLVDVSF